MPKKRATPPLRRTRGVRSGSPPPPTVNQDPAREGPVQCRERLGGLLKYYTHEAA